MEKWFVYILLILLGISLWYDLQKDLLPMQELQAIDQEEEEFVYRYVTANKGDTLISLVERVNHGVFSRLPIEQVIEDFTRLNKGLDYQEIKPNTVYKIPIYTEKKGS